MRDGGMRPHKSQLPARWFWWTAPGVFEWNQRNKFVQFGYTMFEAFVVGAGGGPSGLAGAGGVGWAYPSGGGGGSSLRVRGRLLDLNPITNLGVGQWGAPGGNVGAGNNAIVYAGNGGVGGTSSFHIWAALGGSGGRGGYVNRITSSRVDREAALPGGGAHNPSYNLAGVWNEGTSSGTGGPGGRGETDDGVPLTLGLPGASGGPYVANGFGKQGGGANIGPVIDGATLDVGIINGGVALRIS